MNLEIVDKILHWLASQSVETVCLCPGGRNAPFVVQLEQSQGFEVLSFYDERSAGFFALGRARRDNKPVAIITTSGTAVTEVFSALVEATYSDVPLIVITADRPKRLRGTGAPQTINQKNIFGEHVEACIDIDKATDINFNWSQIKPLHLNVSFDEPLINSEDLDFKVYEAQAALEKEKQSFTALKFKKPLVVLGALSDGEASQVEEVLSDWDGPIYAEVLSRLQNSEVLSNNLLKSGEKIVSKLINDKVVDSVVRIGDVPVGRFWRDLDSLSIPVTSISSKNYKGMESGELLCHSLESLTKGDLSSESVIFEKIQPI